MSGVLPKKKGPNCNFEPEDFKIVLMEYQSMYALNK